MPEISLVAGTIGPFQPQQAVEVPLWLALQLRKEGKCVIMAPEWLSVDFLQTKEAEERQDPSNFSSLPYYFSEITFSLLRNAQQDVKDARKIRTLLANISDLRSCKIKSGLKSITEKVHYIKLNNITSLELYGIKKFTIKTLNSFKSISQATASAADDYNISQSQTQNSME
eukprot:CAMPEP_0167755494 /NCGR_PEP_ID=MMETSP0110_2-20121227/8857_1 /TAXON_ID=629695 /ORGANISM="Gymnochlora sp., Strain CCMP2014" /LENGTH=170 /DNA_ID=CAMNT_0007641491 /DNA_START=54 /DNA_END=563 /DNA_ORIENTATION=+